MVNEIISEYDEDIVDDFICTDAGFMHEDWSKCIEYFNDKVEEIFIPFLTIGELGLPR